MKIRIPFGFNQNLPNFMRRAGYAVSNNPNTGIVSYTRRLSGDYYPRFHVYAEESDGQQFINLHLDQKKPSYPGAHAHNAEYEGKTVEAEGQRLEGLIKNQLDNNNQETKEKKGFFHKLLS